MRGGGQRVGREDQHVVEPQRVPIDLAERSDAGGYLAAEDIDGERVTDTEAERPGCLHVERDERLAAVVGRPPAPGDQFAALGQACAVGHPALAAKEPGAVGKLLEVGDALTISGVEAWRDEALAQFRCELHRGGATVCMVTHDPRYAQHADRGIHLFDGRVVEETFAPV